MHESFFRGLNTSSRLIAEHYCVHGNTSATQLRVALSVSFLSSLFSSALYEKRRQPNLLWILCRDAIMYSQSSRRHLFFLPFSYVFIHTNFAETRVFPFKAASMQSYWCTLGCDQFLPTLTRDNAFVREMHPRWEGRNVWIDDWTIALYVYE